MPDITYLPILAEYFDVSVDQLIGIVPLNEEEYIACKTGSKEFWKGKLEYLLRTRKSMWNDDYMEFLVTKVWKIDKPVKVLDCGCGYGFLGLLIMRYLAEGSTYTGIDMAKNNQTSNGNQNANTEQNSTSKRTAGKNASNNKNSYGKNNASRNYTSGASDYSDKY